MSAPEPPQDDHLTLIPGGYDHRSARRSELGREGRQRRELQPGRKQIEVGIAGGRRSGSGTLRSEFGRDASRIGSATQAHGKESGRVTQSLTHELLEAQPQLRLVGARREVGHTAPLLAERSEARDEVLERGRVGVEQKLAPDGPERRGSITGRLLFWVSVRLRRLFESVSNPALLQPGAGVRHAGRSGDSGERAEPNRVPQQPLGVTTTLQAEGAVENVGALGTDAERRALEARRRAGRTGAQRIAAEQRREFVGGRERVRGLAQRGVGERGSRLLGGSEGRQPQLLRHGVNRPVPIDELRAARGRGGEDCV